MRRPDTGTVVKVYSHAVLKNGWEYYFLDPKVDSRGNIMALVMGFETEMGAVNVKEIASMMTSFTKNLGVLQPCEGWEWVDAKPLTSEDFAL
jgi:hypothetical protein